MDREISYSCVKSFNVLLQLSLLSRSLNILKPCSHKRTGKPSNLLGRCASIDVKYRYRSGWVVTKIEFKLTILEIQTLHLYRMAQTDYIFAICIWWLTWNLTIFTVLLQQQLKILSSQKFLKVGTKLGGYQEIICVYWVHIWGM